MGMIRNFIIGVAIAVVILQVGYLGLETLIGAN